MLGRTQESAHTILDKISNGGFLVRRREFIVENVQRVFVAKDWNGLRAELDKMSLEALQKNIQCVLDELLTPQPLVYVTGE